MSNKSAMDPAKKAKGKIGVILGAIALLTVGGAGCYALVLSGIIGNGRVKETIERAPQLVRKGDDDIYMPSPGEKAEGKDSAKHVYGEGGDQYRTAYYSFGEDFTSNLKDSDALIQLSLACSTRRDGRVLQWLKKHELAIRSSLIQILADTSENEVYTIEGKKRLQRRMTTAINDVLAAKEGFGGVDAVYFRSFIIQ